MDEKNSVLTSPSSTDSDVKSDMQTLSNENNIIEEIPAPPSIDNEIVQVDENPEVQNEIEDGSGNSFDGDKNDKSKKLNNIIFIIIGGLVVLGIAGVGAFAMYKNNNNSIVSEEATDNNFLSRLNNSDESVNSSSASNGGISCQDEYDKLLNVNEFDFDTYCIKQDIRGGKYDSNKIPKKKKNMVLIFDASGSMAAQINGKRKIDIAKEAVWKFIDQVDGEENFALSIVVYGHKGSNSVSQKSISCAGIEEVYYLGDVDAGIAKSKLNAFDATGWTPIAGSFKKAQEILSSHPEDENFILLVSDGKEMCDGDPVAAVTTLRNAGLNVKADVIGFDVGGADEQQLKSIAEAGGGDYFSVSSAIDLENAFAKHKEMLNEADFKIGRTVEQLYDVSFVINNYNQCRVMLKKEEIAMILDIHGNKLVTEACEDFADRQYKERFNEINEKIETIYRADKASFNALK